MTKILIDADCMRKLGRMITKEIPGAGYALLVYPLQQPGIANYISNSHRQDMIKALRETADRLEKNQEFPTPEKN